MYQHQNMNENGNNGCFTKGGTPWNKGLTKETDNRMRKPTKYSIYSKPYVRNCPDCGNEIKYSTVYYFVNALENNRKCNTCANSGKGWQTGKYGYTRTPEIRKKMSESHTGKKLTKEHSKNISIGNLGRSISDEVRLNMRLSAINYIERVKLNGGQLSPNYNISSIPIIESRSIELGITDLQHAENGGEYHIKELGYWVDGYSPEKNIVIEYYEKHHNKNKEQDERRQTEITNLLGCKFIIIREK